MGVNQIARRDKTVDVVLYVADGTQVDADSMVSITDVIHKSTATEITTMLNNETGHCRRCHFDVDTKISVWRVHDNTTYSSA